MANSSRTSSNGATLPTSAATDIVVSLRLHITLPSVGERDHAAVDDIHASGSPSPSHPAATTALPSSIADSHSHFRTTAITSDYDHLQPPTGSRLGSPWSTQAVSTLSLPTSDQLDALDELEATRHHSALRPARRRDPATPVAGSRIHGPIDSNMSSSDLTVPHPSLLMDLKPATSPMKAQQQRRRRERCRTQPLAARSTTTATTSYAPATLQSAFQNAKPRIYRASSRAATPSAAKAVAVVTTTLGANENTVTSQHYDPLGTAAVARSWAPHQQHSLDQANHVAIVTLTEEDLAARLRLDFRASNRKPRHDAPGWGDSRDGQEQNRRLMSSPVSVAWSQLDSEHQRVELMAATRSRAVVREAHVDEIAVPPLAAFLATTTSDVKSQLAIRAFSRWFLASQQSRQRVRELFLREELRCAARDGGVVAALKRIGCAAPPDDCIDDPASSRWIDFTEWYATGRQVPVVENQNHFSVDCEAAIKLQLERLQERMAFLKKRLAALDAVDTDESLATELFFIFDALPNSFDTTAADAPSKWGNLSRASQEKEVALVLLDPTIQIAAITGELVLPDVAIAHLAPHCDVLALAASFVAWWAAPGNVYRQEFLSLELQEATADVDVRHILEKEEEEKEEQEQQQQQQRETKDNTHDHPENTVKSASFMERYFAASSSARVSYLDKKLELLLRPQRIAAITHRGQLPAPMLVDVPLSPLLVAFQFPLPPPPRVEISLPEEPTEAMDTTTANDAEETGQEASVAIEINDDDEDARRRQEQELRRMEEEDALSRQLSDTYESVSDDDQDDDTSRLLVIDSPKRTDFTCSYFFGNLPKAFRINSGGWLAGSGIDNGDEEIEEEERLERERQHQEDLDRLEAERVAEAEREAERMRLEKEMDEKALQQRRLRQVELKKILVHQAQLELQRAAQDEVDRVMRERVGMAAEEHTMRAWLAFLDTERAAMEAEDRRAARIAQAERDARRAEMRRVLAELTQMDAEDRRSTAVLKAQLELERKQKQRIAYLTKVYEHFEPFFPASREPSEAFLPVIRRAGSLRKHRQHKHPTTRVTAKYALSFAEALAIDDCDQEQQHYVTRDSRKLRQLLGLPVMTPQSRRQMRIPSEQEILRSRQELQLMLPLSGGPRTSTEEDRPIESLESPVQLKKKYRLPELVQWKAHRYDTAHLTDLATRNGSLAERRPNQRSDSKSRFNATSSSSSPLHHPQTAALPFFRGNFGVKGESRSHTYTPPH